jgi:hypothetical protein
MAARGEGRANTLTPVVDRDALTFRGGTLVKWNSQTGEVEISRFAWN